MILSTGKNSLKKKFHQYKVIAIRQRQSGWCGCIFMSSLETIQVFIWNETSFVPDAWQTAVQVDCGRDTIAE
jgi:hypothetical protein